MPHGLQLTDHMMTVREPAWHGLGTVLPNLATAEEAIQAAKLDWTVEKRPVGYLTSDSDFEGHPRKFFFPVKNQFATVRMDTGEPLGVVGKKYTPVQNRDAFSFFDQVTQDPGGPKYVTAGSLWGGGRVWMLAKLPDCIEPVKGDIVEEYILFTNTHDGFTRAVMLWTPIRVVCQNTLNMSLGNSSAHNTFRFRHLGTIFDHVESAQEILGLVKQNHLQMSEVIKRLVSLEPTKDQVDQTLRKLFGSYIQNKQTPQAERVQNEIKSLIEDGVGQDIPGVRGTGWALYNGITEYLDYHKEDRPREYDAKDTRLERIWFGNTVDLKTKALDEILLLK